jgi:hypothetical protein
MDDVIGARGVVCSGAAKEGNASIGQYEVKLR